MGDTASPSNAPYRSDSSGLSTPSNDNQNTAQQDSPLTRQTATPYGYDAHITFVGATGLAIGDILTSDPYLIVQLDNRVSYRTRVCHKTLNPVWNEEWDLANIPRNAYMDIRVWDSDRLNQDDPLGLAGYTFDGTLGDFDVTLGVTYRNKPHGKVILKWRVWPSAQAGPLRSLNYVKFTRFTSKLAGVMTSSTTDDEIMSYSTYSIYFPHISDVFEGKKMHWNTAYPAAQSIFGKMPHCMVLRQVIHSEHYFLFKHDQTTTYGTLPTGEEFLQLIKYGKRHGKSRIFNYAIIDESFNFSETGAAFFKDFMSKHAILSGCAEEVYYSGEFHIEETGDGQHKFVIDNNSGTYAPDPHDLKKLADLFRQNFRDLRVEALDREDPSIAAFKKLIAAPVP